MKNLKHFYNRYIVTLIIEAQTVLTHIRKPQFSILLETTKKIQDNLRQNLQETVFRQ